MRRRRYVVHVCRSDELVRDGFKQAAAISCRFNNPISRKTHLSLARVTFKPFRSTFTIGKVRPLDPLLRKMQFSFKIYLSKWYGARRLLSEFPDKDWKLGSIDSLLKRIHKTGTIVRQPGSGRPRSSHSSEGPCAQSGGQAKKAQTAREILHETAVLCSSVHSITQRDKELQLSALCRCK